MQKRCFGVKYLSCVMQKNPGSPSEGVKFFLAIPQYFKLIENRKPQKYPSNPCAIFLVKLPLK